MNYPLHNREFEGRLFDWCENQILGCESTSELVVQFTPIARALGYAHLSIQVIRESNSSFFKQRIFTNIPKAKTKFLGAGIENSSPEMSQKVHKSIAQSQSSRDTKNSSVSRSKSIQYDPPHPTYGHQSVFEKIEDMQGNQAVIILSSPLKQSAKISSDENTWNDLSNLGWMLLDALRYFVCISVSEGAKLNKDELRFLRTLVTSDDPEIAMNRPYSFGTYETVQISIKRKLKVASIFQAIALATKSGILDQNWYDEREVISSFDGLNGFDLL